MYKAIILLVVALVLGVGLGQSAKGRSFVAGRYAIEIDGLDAGWIQLVEGGHATADVVTEKLGGDHLQKKHIGNVKYEDIRMDLGVHEFAQVPGIPSWVNSTLTGQAPRRGGVILLTDYDLKQHSRLDFKEALISEISFPALDGASKEPAYLKIQATPASTRYLLENGPEVAAASSKTKKWLTSNFRLEIPGVDCTRVSKIDSFTVKQSITQVPGAAPSTKLVVPCVKILALGSSATSFLDWHADFVLKNNSGDANEKTAQLFYLDSNLKTPLLELDLRGVGIHAVRPSACGEAGPAGTAVEAEIYCEGMSLGRQAAVPGG